MMGVLRECSPDAEQTEGFTKEESVEFDLSAS